MMMAFADAFNVDVVQVALSELTKGTANAKGFVEAAGVFDLFVRRLTVGVVAAGRVCI